MELSDVDSADEDSAGMGKFKLISINWSKWKVMLDWLHSMEIACSWHTCALGLGTHGKPFRLLPPIQAGAG